MTEWVPFERRLATTDREVEALCNSLSRYDRMGLDTESSGPNQLGSSKPMVLMERSNLTGISLAFPDRTSVYVPCDHKKGGENASIRAQTRLQEALRDYPGYVWVHNLKHELLALRRPPFEGVPLFRDLRRRTRSEGCRWLCSQVGAWLAGVRSCERRFPKKPFGLKELAATYLGLEMHTFREVTGGADFDQLRPKDGIDYACEDAEAALVFGEDHLQPALQSMWDWFLGVEMPTVFMLRDIQDEGMGLDVAHHRDHTLAEMQAEVDRLRAEWEFDAPPGVRLNSNKELAALWGPWEVDQTKDPETQPSEGLGLWDARDIPLIWAGKWRVPSTKAEYIELQLERLPEHSRGWELARIKTEIAAYSKFTGTYGENLLAIAGQYPDGRLHGGLNQTGTETGRFSSRYPNLQNIPKRSAEGKRIREAFAARDGHMLVSADYSQIELRVLAHYCGEGPLLEGYREGRDVHRETADLASEMCGMAFTRDQGKAGNFAPIYGSGKKGAASALGISVEDAGRFLDAHKRVHPHVYAVLERAKRAGLERGYVRTIAGRRRTVRIREAKARMDELRSQGYTYQNSDQYREAWNDLGYEERKAGNTPIQGSAADIVKKGMLAFWMKYGDEWPIVNQVHDDVILEVPEGQAEEAARALKTCLEGSWELRCPLVAEPVWSKRWSDL